MTPCRTGQPCGARGGSLLGLRELTLVPVIVLVIVIGAFASDAFLTTDNFLNILQQSSELSVVVIAETLILLAGKFDLSLESVVGLAPMLGAWLIIKNVAYRRLGRRARVVAGDPGRAGDRRAGRRDQRLPRSSGCGSTPSSSRWRC